MTSTSLFTKFFDKEPEEIDKVNILTILTITQSNFSLVCPTGSSKRAYMKTTAQGVAK